MGLTRRGERSRECCIALHGRHPSIRILIREYKIAQMYSAIQTGGKHCMQALDRCLQDLVRRILVTRQRAEQYARSREIFK